MTSTPDSHVSPLPPGTLLGPYQIVKPLGVGSFAQVYLAKQTILLHEVALKVVCRAEAEGSETEGARMMRKLDHANLVRVEFADRIGGRLVIAMDYVDGPTLQTVLNAGPISESRALEIAIALADALQYLHGFGMAHLDLKPANILIDARGNVRITDFGIAQVYGANAPLRTAGSPAYMAPEQFDGRTGPACDIWATGVLLFRMLTGELLFHGTSVDEYADQVRHAGLRLQAALTRAPETLRPLLARCLALDPAERFTAAELTSALAALGGPEARKCPECGADFRPGAQWCAICTQVTGPAASPLVLPQVSPRRGWRRLLPAGLAVVLAAAGIVYAGWHLAETRQAAKAEIARRAEDEWRKRIASLASSPVGSYQESIASLQRLAAGHPNLPETRAALRNLSAWQEEAALFEASEAVEARAGARICERLSQWQSFLARQTTGFMKSRAAERVSFWKRELENYEGSAVLTVHSAVGLPPSDTGLFGDNQPDPFFVVLQAGRTLYRSRSFDNNPAPQWDENVRIPMKPGTGMTLEIRDKDLIGSKLLFSRGLWEFPADGRFRIVEGTIAIEMEIAREH